MAVCGCLYVFKWFSLEYCVCCECVCVYEGVFYVCDLCVLWVHVIVCCVCIYVFVNLGVCCACL